MNPRYVWHSHMLWSWPYLFFINPSTLLSHHVWQISRRHALQYNPPKPAANVWQSLQIGSFVISHKSWNARRSSTFHLEPLFHHFGSVRVWHSMKSQIRKVSATSEKHCWVKWSSRYCFRSEAIRSLLGWNGGTWWATVAAKGEGQNRYDLITRNRSGMKEGLCEIRTWHGQPYRHPSSVGNWVIP